MAVSWDSAAGRFVARGTNERHEIAINAPREAGEDRASTGFSASELLLAGAGACSAWDVLEIMRKRRHDIEGLEVSVEGQQAADPPWQYERITLHYRLAGEGLRRSVVERVVRLSIMRYCSVLATVSGVAVVEVTLELVGAHGRSTGRRPVPLAQAGASADALAMALADDAPTSDED